MRQLTNAAGAVTEARRYEPFGVQLSAAGNPLTKYAFTGEWQDPTGLIFLRARYYDPATGRFLSKDPVRGSIALPGTLNPYTYAANNPLRYTDPSGEYVESLLDVAFIIFDLASIGLDFYNLYYAAECEKGIIGQQLSIDISALLLDVVFLALPGATGGGLGLRLAFAGGGHLTLAGGVAAWRSLQMGV